MAWTRFRIARVSVKDRFRHSRSSASKFWPSTLRGPSPYASTKEKTDMSAEFLTRLFEKLCPHRFSWPHSGSNGQDYQVCLVCGAVFGYDWTRMCRTGPLVLPGGANNGLIQRKGPAS